MTKCISLWQPWAEAIKRLFKTYETRNWSTPYRGQLVIHAAKRPYNLRQDVPFAVASFMFDHRMNQSEMAFGAAICVVDLVDCIRMTPTFIAGLSRQERLWGNFEPGRYAWKLANVRVFPQPVPWRGEQGLFDYRGPLPRAPPSRPPARYLGFLSGVRERVSP